MRLRAGLRNRGASQVESGDEEEIIPQSKNWECVLSNHAPYSPLHLRIIPMGLTTDFRGVNPCPGASPTVRETYCTPTSAIGIPTVELVD